MSLSSKSITNSVSTWGGGGGDDEGGRSHSCTLSPTCRNAHWLPRLHFPSCQKVHTATRRASCWWRKVHRSPALHSPRIQCLHTVRRFGGMVRMCLSRSRISRRSDASKSNSTLHTHSPSGAHL